MRPTVISDTIQEFLGLRYYLCGNYFQREGVRLHRVVWSRTHGREVPDGFHVHHDDEDRSNNDPDNLVLLPGPEHTSLHQTGHQRGVPAVAIEAAKAWHGSEQGLAWHREHYASTADQLQRDASFICEQCAAPFVAKARGSNRFCCNGCKSEWRRRSGLDDVDRVCAECSASFRINRYRKTVTCSRTCAAALSVRSRRRPE